MPLVGPIPKVEMHIYASEAKGVNYFHLQPIWSRPEL